MGKLNYTNRKSDGLKLGRIVAKDVRKKATTASLKSNPSRESPTLEIVLQGRSLQDDGCAEALSGILESLDRRNPEVKCHLRLEELNLAENCLTAKSLPLLGKLIRAARSDIKDLDLSGNQIRVHTDQEAQDWEEFLSSFRGCKVLCRLNLSGNDLSDSRAFEIFTRVSYKQSLRNNIEDNEPRNDLVDAAQDLSSRIGHLALPRDESGQRPSDAPPATPSPGSECGLRFVSNIILSDTHMTDAGALWLSYMLMEHCVPAHFVHISESLPDEVQPEDYHQQISDSSIVYLPNEKLSGVGQRLLDQAEEVRHIRFYGADNGTQETKDAWELTLPKGSKSRRASSGTVSVGRRRGDSTISVDSGYVQGDTRKADLDLESLRKKVQRAGLQEPKAVNVELWAAALQFLAYSRSILLAPSTMSAHQGLSPAIQRMSALTGAVHITSFASSSHIPINTTCQRDLPMECDPMLPGSLPKRIWHKILEHAASSRGILSGVQQKAIIQYAENRVSLKDEQLLCGKPESVQIWTVLHSIGCLEYDMKM